MCEALYYLENVELFMEFIYNYVTMTVRIGSIAKIQTCPLFTSPDSVVTIVNSIY